MGWLVVGSLGVGWGRQTEDSFGSDEGRKRGYWDGLGCGVGMEIDMVMGMNISMGLSRCREVGSSAVHMY